ncbi:hypothetical protein AB0D90_14560 [Streptomyces althioticus]|uniref:hypothetical protein n=1 Tax=Streptomyces althioticus TaxID=83380 RepID=UPI0033F1681B
MTTDTTAPETPDLDLIGRLTSTALSPEERAEMLEHVAASAPGIDDDTALRVLYLTLGAMAAHGDAASGQAAVQNLIQTAADAKEKWAVAYMKATESRQYEQYRTTYNEALRVGTSPAGVLRVVHKLDEATAKEAVKFLKKTTPNTETSES